MITEISLANFKCFKHLDSLHLSRVTLLAGINGRGKSTVLQSLLLLAQSMDREKRLNHIEFDGEYVRLGTFDDVLTRGAKSGCSIGFKTDDVDENELKLTFSSFGEKAQWGRITSFELTNHNLVEEKATSESSDEVKYSSLGVTSTVKGLSQLYSVFYVAADRLGPLDYGKVDDNRAENHIGIHGEFLINSLFAQSDEFRQEVSTCVSEILGGASLRVEKIDPYFLRMYMDSADCSSGFRPSNIGFGYSYILPVVASVLLAEPNAKIFIENPEAHLHPGAQSRLGEFLIRKAREKNLQLFVETHSEHIINALRIAVCSGTLPKDEASIIFFSRDWTGEPEVTQIKIDRHVNLSGYPDGFLDEWGQQMSKLV